MCKECGKTFCGNACPSFTGYIPGRGARLSLCSSCGDEIDADDYRYVLSGQLFCKECVERRPLCETAELFGFLDVAELIGYLGGEYCRD